jgi:hypothetical protein
MVHRSQLLLGQISRFNRNLSEPQFALSYNPAENDSR